MNLVWLNKKNNPKLIVFFNGWGMDENIVKHLNCEDYDVLTISDYNKLSPLPSFENYTETHVVAWSMGVMIATIFGIAAKSVTAINGTPHPIHIDFGINPKVYKLMELGFDEKSKNKFFTKMFDTVPSNFIEPQRETQNQKNELTVLKTYTPNTEYHFSRVIVSDNDKIIPTTSQLNYWKTPEKVAGGHCIFYNYGSWKELL